MEGYDLIGDVHGCGATLALLLERLGYHQQDGVYRHPDRRVIFLGDLIDRGPRIRQAVTIARRMVEAGEAYMVLGNHEIHALAYCHRSPGGSEDDWMRAHTPRNARILEETLAQYQDHPTEWQQTLAWFLQQPLYLELPGLRVVHACWDPSCVERLRDLRQEGRIDLDFLAAAMRPGTEEACIVERLTRGHYLMLPEGMDIHSEDGTVRRTARAHFWARQPRTWGDVVFQPDRLPAALESRALSEDERVRLGHYDTRQPPLFIGHYWCAGIPALPAPNIACLDYSAVKFGRLVAYRWSGEARLTADHFAWVEVSGEEGVPAMPWETDVD
ncbi:metallophosphoesterase [Halomonas sp. 18H]|nr:metallophosphoesterase [Halomonas sp. 18H]MCW4151549.1 metallophosphoesterase [Halomonas sp. 18H]